MHSGKTWLINARMAGKKRDNPKKLNGHSIVLMGGSGFLGGQILKYLETNPKYSKVVVIDYKKPSITLKKTRYYKLDLTDTMADVSLAEILKAENCDTLIHTAFPISPMRNESKAHEIIAIGTFYIFNACHAAGVRKVVMSSTTDVYGAFPTNPNFLTEDMPPKGNLQNRYLADRIDAEKQAIRYQKMHPDHVVTVLRSCTTLGPTIDSFKTRLMRRPAIMTMLGFDPLLQFTHEDDVLAIFKKAIENDYSGIFNIGGDGVLPLSRVIKLSGSFNVPVTQLAFKTLAQVMWMSDLSPAPATYADFLRYICVVDNSRVKSVMKYNFKYNSKEALLNFIEAGRIHRLKTAEQAAA